MIQLSLEEAKDLFMSMNCSTFVMAREDLPLYELYRKLNIDKQIEKKWREEKLLDYYNKVKEGVEETDIIKIYNYMEDIVENLKTLNSLKIIMEVTTIILIKLKDIDRVIIAESIIGRLDISERSGFIYGSYDLGDKDLACCFFNLILSLIDFECKDKNIIKRLDNIKKLYGIIKNELYL
jgi:hypothetical protein